MNKAIEVLERELEHAENWLEDCKRSKSDYEEKLEVVKKTIVYREQTIADINAAIEKLKG